MNKVQHQNLWALTAGHPLELPQISGDTTADLVIIGGGFTGCAAALEAAKIGMSVVLLEAETIGHGGSGRNVGLVNAGLWTPPDEVEETLGAEAGEKLNARLAAAPDLVFELIDQHQIDCDAVRNGTLHCAHSKAGVSDLQNRFAQQQNRKAPVRLLDAAETQNRTGSTAIHGALFDPRAGTIQPLKYCLGLANAAIEKGAQLFERSPVIAYARKDDQWVVAANGAEVKAKYLLDATNAYNSAAQPVPSFTMVHYFQLATEPLSTTEREKTLPGLEGCWDTALVMSSFRYDKDGRLLIGSIGSLDQIGGRIHENWAREKLGQLFPELAHKRLDYAWDGQIAMTKDHLPKIKRLGPNGYSVFGYSGRGIGPGTVFGTSIAKYICSGDQAELPITPIAQYAENWTKTSALYYESGAVLTHAAFSAKQKLGI